MIVPIIGARRLDQLKDNLAAIKIELPAEHMARLDAVSAIELGFPYDFINSAPARELPYGASWDRLDDHRRDRSGRAIGT